MDHRIRHHLRLARAAAIGGAARERIDLAGVVGDLTMVLAHMHAEKAIGFDTEVPVGLAVACDRQEMSRRCWAT